MKSTVVAMGLRVRKRFPWGRATVGHFRCRAAAACIGLAALTGPGLPGARAASAAGSSIDTACSDQTTESLIREFNEEYNEGIAAYGEDGPQPSARRLVVLTCLIEKSPLDPRWYAERGEEYTRQENYPAAIQDHTTEIHLATRRNQPTSHGYLSRAESYEGTRQYDAAVSDYQEVIRRGFRGGPTDLVWSARDAHFRMCSVRARIYSLFEAVEACNLALAVEPGTGRLWEWLAIAYFKAGQFVEAARYFDQSWTASQEPSGWRDDNAVSALYGRGVARLQLGDVVRGRADIEQARRSFPPIVDDMAEYGVVEGLTGPSGQTGKGLGWRPKPR